ncbi:MAG TPA: hypothetical protein VK574_05890 [Terracidiphilus sp.]|nr:hypothetical protein [Terracidiphilus sp.]
MSLRQTVHRDEAAMNGAQLSERRDQFWIDSGDIRLEGSRRSGHVTIPT